jgi:uroporphyrinogen decarboxylase
MVGRERILAALDGKDCDRVPLTEIGIWPETIKRWEGEGFPRGVSPQDYFGLDKIEFLSFDCSLGFKEITIRETRETKVYTDNNGCTYRMLIDEPGASEFITSSVKSEDDWHALKTNLAAEISRFDNFSKDIVFGGQLSEDQPSRYEKCRAENLFTALVPTEPCWYYLRLLGEEEALVNVAANPDFAGLIIEEYNNFTIDMLKKIFSRGYRFDALWVFSDLCYKNGMLFSPRFFREKVLPQQIRLFDLARENGMKVIYHSDGNVNDILPLLIEAGIDCIQPLEVRAGNDVRHYIDTYADAISYIGNINMDLFTTSKKAIEQEVSSKILSAKGSHRYLFHSDHSVPYTVSLENYSYGLKIANDVAWY